jgi:predicted GIY-YIG superfamily endonuclease
MADFYLYILKCNDNSYYIGHTDDIEKRLYEHEQAIHFCYTSTRLPVKLVYIETFQSRYDALVAEQKIKRWSRKKKEALIRKDWDCISNLAKKKF